MADSPDDLPVQWSTLYLLIVLAGVLMVGGTILLGWPGALFALAVEPPVNLIRGEPIYALTAGDDEAFGVHLLLTYVTPPAFPMSYWLARTALPNLRGGPRTLLVLLGAWIWSAVILLWVSYS
jgi:hypothetical protein